VTVSLLLLRFSSLFFDIPMYSPPVGIPLPTLPLYLLISILVADLCTLFILIHSFILLASCVRVLVNFPFLEVVPCATWVVRYDIRDLSRARGVIPDTSFSNGLHSRIA
jgi:hypothetical protein